MKRHTVLFGAFALFLGFLPPALMAQFVNPDLQTGKKVVKSVLVLPAQANVVKSGVKGNEPLVDESRALGASFTTEVSDVLTNNGRTVLPNSFNDDALSQNSDMKYALADLQTRFDKVWAQIAKKPKDVRTGRYTMGDDVVNFSPGASADALVFIRGQESIYTGGKKLLGAIAGVYVPGSSAILNIVMVDAQSGAVLYVDSSAPGIVANNIKKSFKKFDNPKPRK